MLKRVWQKSLHGLVFSGDFLECRSVHTITANIYGSLFLTIYICNLSQFFFLTIASYNYITQFLLFFFLVIARF